MAGAIWFRLCPWLISQDKKAMVQPVLSAPWSVGSVWFTKSGMPSWYHVGAVAKSDRALLPITAAHHRLSPSPVLSPHRFPPMLHSLSSASNSADTRAALSNEAHTSIAAPVV